MAIKRQETNVPFWDITMIITSCTAIFKAILFLGFGSKRSDSVPKQDARLLLFLLRITSLLQARISVAEVRIVESG